MVSSTSSRRLRRQLARQIEREREQKANGAPFEATVPPKILARLTKPQAPVFLHQVVVTVRATGRPLAVGPACAERMAGALAEVIADHIRRGLEKGWINPLVVPVIAGQRRKLDTSLFAA